VNCHVCGLIVVYTKSVACTLQDVAVHRLAMGATVTVEATAVVMAAEIVMAVAAMTVVMVEAAMEVELVVMAAVDMEVCLRHY